VPIVLENDRVIVQRIDFQPGKWAGEHEHAGNQLVVLLDALEMNYKEGEDEVKASYKAGAVFWVDAGTHDHAALNEGSGILVTLK
jgi:quercetin dioxygenase-like cupin family protein